MATFKRGRDRTAVEAFPGIVRRTMAHDDDLMLCHFVMKKGAEVPLHNHVAVQNGFVVSGRVQFLDENGETFAAEAGDGYLFASLETHGTRVLEDAVVIECFCPSRPEYAEE